MLYFYVRWKIAKRKQRCQTNDRYTRQCWSPWELGQRLVPGASTMDPWGVKLPTPIGLSCPEAELQVGTKHHGLQQQRASFHPPLLTGHVNAVLSPILRAWEICQGQASSRLDPMKSKMDLWAQLGTAVAPTSAGRNTGVHAASNGF